MKTTITADYDKEFTIGHRGTVLIIQHITEDGQVVKLECSADELLQAVKAHHALTKAK